MIPTIPEPRLTVRRLVKSFAGTRAVDGLDFDVRPGEIFGFLGPNGAGKTTTLRAVLGIIRPDSGAVRFEGRPSLDRRRVGYLPEERGLFDDAPLLDTLVYLGTLRGMPLRPAARSAAEWLDRLGLGDRSRAKLNTLSRGNQQKVQFAGAVLHRPALAVLDEPFSGLDPLNQELFLRMIQELRAQGSAVLLSAHNLDLAERLCDRFLLIAKGREVLAGTLEGIRRDAARGAGEVLVVTLRDPRGDGAPGERAVAVARGCIPDADVRVRDGAGPEAAIEVAVPTGADLGPLLGALGAGFAIVRVAMRALSLHEIYLRTVGREQGAPCAGEGADG